MKRKRKFAALLALCVVLGGISYPAWQEVRAVEVQEAVGDAQNAESDFKY